MNEILSSCREATTQLLPLHWPKSIMQPRHLQKGREAQPNLLRFQHPCAPQICTLEPTACDGIRMQGVRVIKIWGQSSQGLLKQGKRSLSILSTIWWQSEKCTIQDKVGSADTKSDNNTFILNFPDPVPWEINFWCLWTMQFMVFNKQTKTLPYRTKSNSCQQF